MSLKPNRSFRPRIEALEDRLTPSNTAPTFVNPHITSPVQEGSIATLQGAINEPDVKDVVILNVNWGDGSPVQSFRILPTMSHDVNLNHRYRDDGNFTIRTFTRDLHGGSSVARVPIQVTNVVPTTTNLQVSASSTGLVVITGTVNEPGLDGVVLRVNWGDGTSSVQRFGPGTHNFRLTHRFVHGGQFEVQLTTNDGSESTQLSVAFTVPDLPPKPSTFDFFFWMNMFESQSQSESQSQTQSQSQSSKSQTQTQSQSQSQSQTQSQIVKIKFTLSSSQSSSTTTTSSGTS